LGHAGEPLDHWFVGCADMIEFFADKFPAVNHVNDAIQTFVRPVAGAILFAASARVITDVHPVISLCRRFVCSWWGARRKSWRCAAVTATTGGAGNVPVSIWTDIVSAVVSFFSIVIPILFAMS